MLRFSGLPPIAAILKRLIGMDRKKLLSRFNCSGLISPDFRRIWSRPRLSAAVSDKQFGLIEHWLQPVRDVAKTGFSGLKNGAWTEAELDQLCEASVVSQVQRLANTPTLQAAWEAGKDVSIHGWVYGLKMVSSPI